MRWPTSGGALEIGLRRALHVREERLSTRNDACRLLYVSDIHLRSRRSGMLCRQVLDAVAGCRPDVVLLGGDLVDGASELGRLRDLVGRMRDVAPVLAVGGNHDQWVGMDRVREAVEQAGGRWIHDGTARVAHGERVITVSGPEAAAPVEGHVRVLCAHNPRIWNSVRRARRLERPACLPMSQVSGARSRGSRRSAGYDLVLAGHLHGCQIVACEYRDRLFPGAMLYPCCVLRRHHGPARLVVSRGVSDLVPIRWRCPREAVLCCV